MTEVTLASLAMDFDVRSAGPAKQQTDQLRASSRALEEQSKATSAAVRDQAIAQGLSGTAAGRAEASMKSLASVYGQARDALGRFTAVDGSFRLSQEATALVTIRNAQAQAALAKEQEKAAAQVAAATKRYDALRASLDPLAAIEVTLAQRTQTLNDAMAKGVITSDQYAAMLVKVNDAARAGVDGVNRYAGGLKNGGQHLTQFSFQLNDIATGLISGQKPMQVLAQQGGQVFQIFQQAAIEAGGFKAAIRALTAEVVPFIATFGPWIAGLTAVGAAVFYLVDQQNKQAKAVEETSKRLAEQNRALAQISPLLVQARADADLAADGQRNFDEWLKKTNVSLAEQIRLQRIKTLNDTNDAALKAGEELRKAKAEFDRISKPGTQMGFSTGVGAFSTISAAESVNKQSELYRKAAANLKVAQETADAVQNRLAQQGQAPDPAFGKQTEAANSATGAVRGLTKALTDNAEAARGSAVSMVGLGDDVLQFAIALEKQNAQAGMSAEQLKRLEIQTAILLAPTDELRERLTRAADAWERQIAFAKDAAAAQKTVKDQQGDTIKTLGAAVPKTDAYSKSLDELSYAYERAARSAGNFAGSIVDGDLGGAVRGLSDLFKDVSKLTGKDSSIGKLLGKAGNFLGPVGEAFSAATSVLGAIGQKSAEAAQKKLEALNQGVQDLKAANMASSGSVVNALDQATKLWNADLEYSSAMVTSLRSIDSQIGSLASALGRSISTGGLLDTSGLGLGTTGSTKGSILGVVGGLLFGSSKTKTELLDQGLQFNPTTYGQGVTGSTYADLATTKTSKLLGVTTGVKVSNSTVTGGLDAGLLSQINGVIAALGSGVIAAATTFGDSAAEAARKALESATIDIGKLSLKGLSAKEIEDLLNATFSKVGDDLAKAGVPGLDSLAKVGEGAFETLTRVAREYQVVDVALASIGKTFGAVGLESIAARDGLVKLFGSLDDFSSKTSFFAANFFTETEKLDTLKSSVNEALKPYGLSADSAREQFKNLVLGLDLTTESGQTAYATLLSVAPAFDKVATAAENATDAAKAAQKAIDDQAEATRRANQETNIGLQRQLMAMDDKVTGGTSARDADRADELAKLDPLGQALKKIIWARQDEQEIIDRNNEALATRKGVQDRIDALTLSSAELLAKSRAAEREELLKTDAAIGPWLDKLYALEDAAKTQTKADELQAEIDKLTLTDTELLTKQRAKERAELVAINPALGELADKLFKAQDNVKALAHAAEVTDKLGSIQDRVDDLILTPAQKLAKSREKEMAEYLKLDASLGPYLQHLYDIEDATKAAADAEEARTKAIQDAEELARKTAELQVQRQQTLADVLEAQGKTEEARFLRRSTELATETDPVLRALKQQLFVAEDYAERVTKARDVLTKAYTKEQDAITATKNKFAEMGKTLRDYSKSLVEARTAVDPVARRAAAQRAFVDAANKARLGDSEAAALIPSLGEAFRSASEAAAVDQLAYLRDLAAIKNATDLAADTAQRQEDVADLQLKALKQQVAGLIDVEEATVDVGRAVAEMKAALYAQANDNTIVQVQRLNEQLSAIWDLNATIVAVSVQEKSQNKQLAEALLEVGAAQLQVMSDQIRALINVNNSVMTVYAGTQSVQAAVTSLIPVLNALKVTAPGSSTKVGFAGTSPLEPEGFATGGSFMVGGSGGADSQFVPLALSPGELVNVSRPDVMAAVLEEVRGLRADNAALRNEVAALRSDGSRTARASEKTANTLVRVSRDGDSLITTAA